MRIAEDFGFSDNESMNSLRDTLTKLKVIFAYSPANLRFQSDRLHIPPPPKDGDLAETPTKALGPVLAKPLGTIHDEISEIQSRHSLAICKFDRRLYDKAYKFYYEYYLNGGKD